MSDHEVKIADVFWVVYITSHLGKRFYLVVKVPTALPYKVKTFDKLKKFK